ncbi:hypothetical protein KFL_009910010, partial [Klebsormidium nitens]
MGRRRCIVCKRQRCRVGNGPSLIGAGTSEATLGGLSDSRVDTASVVTTTDQPFPLQGNAAGIRSGAPSPKEPGLHERVSPTAAPQVRPSSPPTATQPPSTSRSRFAAFNNALEGAQQQIEEKVRRGEPLEEPIRTGLTGVGDEDFVRWRKRLETEYLLWLHEGEVLLVGRRHPGQQQPAKVVVDHLKDELFVAAQRRDSFCGRAPLRTFENARYWTKQGWYHCHLAAVHWKWEFQSTHSPTIALFTFEPGARMEYVDWIGRSLTEGLQPACRLFNLGLIPDPTSFTVVAKWCGSPCARAKLVERSACSQEPFARDREPAELAIPLEILFDGENNGGEAEPVPTVGREEEALAGQKQAPKKELEGDQSGAPSGKKGKEGAQEGFSSQVSDEGSEMEQTLEAASFAPALDDVETEGRSAGMVNLNVTFVHMVYKDRMSQGIQGEAEDHDIRFVRGDVTKLKRGAPNEPAIVVSLCDDSGRWGATSVFKALEWLSPEVRRAYEADAEADDLHVGDLHLVPVTGLESLYVALAVVRGFIWHEGTGRRVLLLDELALAFEKLAAAALQKTASVHFLGVTSGGGRREWPAIVEEL